MTGQDDVIDVIEAFADGEAVDPGGLMRALSDRAGREHLVDLLVLRGFVGDHGFPAHPAEPVTIPPARHSRARLLSIAAALILISAAGGFVAGERLAPRAPAGIASADSGPRTPVVAPKPTHVIYLQKGVDWKEQAGGH